MSVIIKKMIDFFKKRNISNEFDGLIVLDTDQEYFYGEDLI